MVGRFPKFLPQLLLLLVGLWLGIDLLARLGAEVLWFQELGYLSIFLLRLQTQGVLWLAVTGMTAGFLFANLCWVQRWQHIDNWVVQAEQQKPKTYAPAAQSGAIALPNAPVLRLRWLLPFVLGLNGAIAFLLLQYGQVAQQYWQQDGIWQRWLFNVPAFSAPALPQFLPNGLWSSLQLLLAQPGWGILGLAVLGGLTIAPRLVVLLGAGGLSLGLGWMVSSHWANVLQAFHAVSFDRSDPLFGRDVSFYVFALPIWQLLRFWWVGVLLYSLLAVAVLYLRSGDSLSQGVFPGFSPVQLRHLQGLIGGLMLMVSLSYWVGCAELLYSRRGVLYGAGYTEVNVQLPTYIALSGVSGAIALWLFWQVLRSSQSSKSSPDPRFLKREVWSLGLGLSGFWVLAAIAGLALPNLVQSLVVQPNEFAREQPYLQRSIALTRAGFNLDTIDAQTFNPQGNLTYQDLQDNARTTRNVRLWDTRPLLETNRQLQQIRLYYRFADADVDRYTLKTETLGQSDNRQVLIAARELDYGAVSQEAKTWVNEHLVYTHGYGFTISPVNTVGPGGLPDYFVKDIGITPETGTNNPNPTTPGVNPGSINPGSLNTSSPLIRASIPIGHPRIYFGEITDTYIMTATNIQELDYPSGNDNAYNTYDGLGGISIGSFDRRLLFAKYLNDWQMLVTRNFTPQTKILFRRNINQRIRAIAPFLRYDSEPYLVAANADLTGGQEAKIDRSYLFWIIDAYTVSDRYPYSDPGTQPFNYIRNSVKVVVDAYHGIVKFYITDPEDPLIASWSKIFPGLFQPLSAMPVTLRSHIRYPVDLFSIQSQQLLTYHMIDAQVFYNREDQWQIPNEIYGNQQQRVEPYYLIMKLPTGDAEEFILLSPFTPQQRNNLIGWLAARSDGQHYGRLVLYEFPKQQLVYGPEQIEARINQDPLISQQISLWNRQGSRAIQGNLLVIPIEQSLLYVEPLYLEAEQTSLPTLVRVIVAYENRIAMAETLDAAIRAVFLQPETPAAPIVRSVDAEAPTN